MLLLTSFHVFSQEVEEFKFRTYFDYGYFASSYIPASKNGNYLSAGAGYKINEDFSLNLTIVKISSTGKDFDDNPFFFNNKTLYNNTMIVPNFSKDWQVHNRFLLSGVLGSALIFENVLLPEAHLDSNNNITGFSFSNEGDSFNIALYGEFIIKYEMTKNLYLSINAKSYVSMYLEPDSIMIGVGIEMKL